MNTNQKLDHKPNISEWFWILLGFNYLLHHFTYFGIDAITFKANVQA